MTMSDMAYTQIKSIIEYGPKAVFMQDAHDLYGDGHDDITPQDFQEFCDWMSRSDYGISKTAAMYKIAADAFTFWKLTNGKTNRGTHSAKDSETDAKTAD